MTEPENAPAPVRSAAADGVVTITLDSPANRNALSRRLVSGLTEALADAADDAAARAVVLTHAGRTFCSGADLAEARAHGMAQGTRDLLALFRQVLTLPLPVVARVDGATRAGGLGLLGACDVVVASSRSSFAFTEVRLGLAPAIISAPLAHRLTSRALSRYFVSGETFDAGVAERIGLVSQTADDVDTALEPLLAALRLGSRQGLQESKRLGAAPLLRSLDADGEALAELSARLFASPEARERMASFLQRPPSTSAPAR